MKRKAKKKIHPSDRPMIERHVRGTTSLAGSFIFYLIDYFLNDISQNLPIEKPASKGEVYMLPLICCVLMAADFEATRNELFFSAKKPRSRNIGKDLVSLLSGTIPSHKGEILAQAINEVFVLRDSIIHGHLYEVSATYYNGTKDDPFAKDTRNYRLKKIAPTLVKQGDPKFLLYVNLRHKQTKYLKLNVIPLNVNFADLYTVLALYDVIDSIYLRKNGHQIFTLPLAVHGMIRGSRPGERPVPTNDVPGSLGQILGHYYQQKAEVVKHKGKILKPRSRINSLFKKRTDAILTQLKKDFGKYVSKPSEEMTCVVDNVCPKCNAFGFQTPFSPFGKCWKCQFDDPREKTYVSPYF